MLNFLQTTGGSTIFFSRILCTALKFITLLIVSQVLVVFLFAMLLLFEGIVSFLRFLVGEGESKNKRKK
jgi:hypothetical protein